MGHEELLADLRRKSGERIRDIWAKVRSEAEEYASVLEEEYLRRKEEMGAELEELHEKAAAPVLHQARRDALEKEDEALRRLADRLYQSAVDRLPELRGEGYAGLFAAFVGELPELEWEAVRVHPDDRELAARHFPQARVEAEEGITGGFEAVGMDGRLRVVNTLENRLEKVWPSLLPSLIRAVLEKHNAWAAV
ncbi:MAG: hypothetical protein Kow0089_02190 [Desulfobulbaceae bacterium]